MIVLDASALVELLVGGSPRASRIAARIRTETLHAPHLVDLEVLSVLRGLEARRTLPTAVASQAAADLVRVAMTRHSHEPLVARIWQLRDNLTAYDACYVALAEGLAAPLITCDGRLAGAPGHRARIELFA